MREGLKNVMSIPHEIIVNGAPVWRRRKRKWCLRNKVIQQMPQLTVMKTRHLLILALSCFAFIFGFPDESSAGEIEKGLPEAPPTTKAVLGKSYRGDGPEFNNVYLTLKERGNYSAEWHGCLGKYGESSGKWTLDGKQIF